MIIFQDVCKEFGTNRVLDCINCALDAGEFVFVVGPSGVGKSTLLHLLIGAEDPSSGRILIDDIELKQMSHHGLQLYRRKIGMVFQDFKLLPRKTVYENVRFALEATDENFEQIPVKVAEALFEVGLQGKEDAFPEELSGGEKQRTAIARALVHRPNLIIADEPTGNLDPATSQEIIKLLLDINRKNGVTVMVATHDKEIVNAAKKRVIQLQEGNIVRDERKGSYHYAK